MSLNFLKLIIDIPKSVCNITQQAQKSNTIIFHCFDFCRIKVLSFSVKNEQDAATVFKMKQMFKVTKQNRPLFVTKTFIPAGKSSGLFITQNKILAKGLDYTNPYEFCVWVVCA